MRKLWTVIIIGLLAAAVRSQSVIAQDSAGLVVEVKEKYGGILMDTCTVVLIHGGMFVLVKRTGESRWFPTSFHSVRIIKHLKERGVL